MVTSFEYQLHAVGPTVHSGLVFYPAEEAAQVLAVPGRVRAAPDELTTLINLTTAPPVPFLPEAVHGTPIIGVGGCWSGHPAAGETATAPFRSLGTVIADVFAANPYAGWQQALDPLYPRGIHNYFRSAFLRELDDPALRALEEAFATLPNPLAEIHLQHLGGAVGRVPAQDTAYAFRDQEFIVNVIARTPDADGFAESVAWARGVAAAHRAGRRHLRELRRRPRPVHGTGVVPARNLPTTGGTEEQVRPDQPVPAEPEHPPHPVILISAREDTELPDTGTSCALGIRAKPSDP